MPSAAIGAVIAACIAAAVSLLGLIISKEQKTSEFRQAWIDALRAELTVYLTKVNSISDAARHMKESDNKLDMLSPLLSALNSASFNISLRLNRNEVSAKAVFAAMKEFEGLFSSGDIVRPEQMRPVEQKLLRSAQDLLKAEWKRVKSGEITFRLAKYACAVVLVGALAYGVYFAFWGGAQSGSERSGADQKSSLVNIVISPSENERSAASQVDIKSARDEAKNGEPKHRGSGGVK